MSLNIVFHADAWEDLVYWSAQDKKTFNRILKMIEAIQRNPFTGIGKPEPLKGRDYHGYWSRRLDQCNRIIYKVDSQNFYLVQLRGHYTDT